MVNSNSHTQRWHFIKFFSPYILKIIIHLDMSFAKCFKHRIFTTILCDKSYY